MRCQTPAKTQFSRAYKIRVYLWNYFIKEDGVNLPNKYINFLWKKIPLLRNICFSGFIQYQFFKDKEEFLHVDTFASYVSNY